MEDLKTRLERLEEWRIQTDTRLAIAETDIKTMKEDLSTIKDNTTWILRLVIGAIVAAVLGLVIKGGV